MLDGVDEKLRLAPPLLVEEISNLPVGRISGIELDGKFVLFLFFRPRLSSKFGSPVQQFISPGVC